MTAHRKYPRGPTVRATVTKEILAAAKLRDSSHCMTAVAVKDAIPAARSISVDLQTIRFSLPELHIRCTYLTPRIVQLAIIRWDQGKMPEPFQFQLRQAHVTSMYTRKNVATPASRERTAKQALAVAKARTVNPSHQIGKQRQELADKSLGKGRVRGGKGGGLPVPLGGRPPPTTPLSRRRAFGLRAMQM